MAETLTATFQTSLGTIAVKLLSEKAPKTVANFVGLAEGTKEWKDPKSGQAMKKPLYDGTVFHRVIPDFMIQRGGPGHELRLRRLPREDGEQRHDHQQRRQPRQRLHRLLGGQGGYLRECYGELLHGLLPQRR